MMTLLYRAADALRRRTLRADHGRMGEDMAHRYLRSQGCTIVARNFRPRGGGGEIDLVAWHAERLVFVEVKTRATADFGSPDAAVDQEKRDAVRHAARDYARRARIDWARIRFDIISIVLAKPPQIEWRKDAFR
jgi:putative endonuclease